MSPLSFPPSSSSGILSQRISENSRGLGLVKNQEGDPSLHLQSQEARVSSRCSGRNSRYPALCLPPRRSLTQKFPEGPSTSSETWNPPHLYIFQFPTVHVCSFPYLVPTATHVCAGTGSEGWGDCLGSQRQLLEASCFYSGPLSPLPVCPRPLPTLILCCSPPRSLRPQLLWPSLSSSDSQVSPLPQDLYSCYPLYLEHSFLISTPPMAGSGFRPQLKSSPPPLS